MRKGRRHIGEVDKVMRGEGRKREGGGEYEGRRGGMQERVNEEQGQRMKEDEGKERREKEKR